MTKLGFHASRMIVGAVFGIAALMGAQQASAILPGSLAVTVWDSVSGNPVENCTVKINPQVFADVTANLDGVYNCGPLLDGVYTVTVTSPCYPSMSKSVSITGSQFVNLTFALARYPLPSPKHSADVDGNGIISLSEQLRVIQLYNSSAYHCEAGTEDGYAPGTGATNCSKHKSDYNPADWVIALSEVLRLIQLYNSPGYHKQSGTEDGYAPNCYS